MKPLFEATLEAVDRAVRCYAAEDGNIDPAFWEPLYGPYGDLPQDIGMLPWGDFDLDYSEC